MLLTTQRGSVTGAVNRIRWPLIVLIGSAGFALVASAAAAYARFPWSRPDGWASPLLVLLLFAYFGSVGLLFIATCADVVWRSIGRRQTLQAASPAAPYAPVGPTSGPRFLWAALALGALVLVQTAIRLDTGSGAWATSRPAHELHTSSADGYVAWIDGQPVHQESQYAWSQVMNLLRRHPRSPVDFPAGIARPGNAGYAFVTALVAPVAAWPAGLYGAFVLVNVALWWLAALCVFDLTRQATGSWWTGAIAGALTTAGTGFVFGATNALSGSAAYAVVACVLWLVQRLRVFSAAAPIRDLALVGCIAAMAGLFYGVALMYIALGAVLFIGRTELRRLVVWAASILLMGQVWAEVLRFAMWQADPGLPAPSVTGVLMVAGLVGVIVAMGTLPARWIDPVLAAVVLLGVGVLVALLILAPAQLRQLANASTTTLHLPRYLGDAGDVVARVSGQFFGGMTEFPERLRQQQLDGNFLAAFPAGVSVLALIGLGCLRRSWREWCIGIVCVVALITTVYNSVSGVHHPRLAYFAWPAVYVAAAAGVRGISLLTYLGASSVLRLPSRGALLVAVLAALMCIAPAVYGAAAPLWGDWSLDDAFHYLNEAR